MKALMAVLLLLTTACQAGQQRPTPIEKDDVCAQCKMAISQPRYAAQIVDKEGDSFKFDDIVCMLRFARERKLRDAGAGFFVMNYETGKQWLDASNAVFVKSAAMDTPMSGGIGAFRDRAAAMAFVAKNKGELLTFDQLLSSDAGAGHAQHGMRMRGPCSSCRRSRRGA